MDGVLLTVEAAKKSLGIDYDTDDAHISDLIMDAESAMVRYLNVPIFGQEYVEYFDGPASRLFLHHYPVKVGSVTIVDLNSLDDNTDDETLTEDVDFRVIPEEGTIHKIASSAAQAHVREILFLSGLRRWKVTYTAGLEFGPDWHTEDQYVLRSSIRYLVVDMYNNPDPRISQERFGTGTGVSLDRAEIPGRIREIWDNFRCDMVVG